MPSELQFGKETKASQRRGKAQHIKPWSCSANDSQQETASWQPSRAESAMRPATPAMPAAYCGSLPERGGGQVWG